MSEMSLVISKRKDEHPSWLDQKLSDPRVQILKQVGIFQKDFIMGKITKYSTPVDQ